MRVNFSFLVILYLASGTLTEIPTRNPKKLGFSSFVVSSPRLRETLIDGRQIELLKDAYEFAQEQLSQNNPPLDEKRKMQFLKQSQTAEKKLDELLRPTKWGSAKNFLKSRKEAEAAAVVEQRPDTETPVDSEPALTPLQIKKNALIEKARQTFLAGVGEEAKKEAIKYFDLGRYHQIEMSKAHDKNENHKRMKEMGLSSGYFEKSANLERLANKQIEVATQAYERYLAENLPLLK